MGLFGRKAGPTVLVCDGDADTLAAVCKTLKKEKYKLVGRASSGKEGLEKWAKLRPQIILIGAPLTPEPDAIGLLRAIRHTNSEAKVIFMGRFANSDEGRDAVREVIVAGASDIIAKTDTGEVPPENLIKKMKAAADALA